MAAGDPGVLKRNFSATAIQTSLVNSISSAATGDTTTSVAVVSVSGFPSTVPYTLILDPDGSKEEVVTVTAATSTTLTITRGQDSTPAVAHSAGTSVRHGVSGRDFKEQQTHIAARGVDADTAILSSAGQTHVHGLVTGDGSVVGADQLVTLTRKTLTTPTINGATLTGTVTSTASIVVSGAGTITGLSSAGMVASSATPKSYVDAILGSATAAATSATSAATSATSAATSATSAAASASASASSASAAATSASSALTSETAAATSATSAAASATAAATSATSAATSASSALTSQTAAATSAASAATSATDAATTYDNFDDRYLGSKASAPTVDNDGNTLLVGAIYWNSTVNNMYVWSGTVWVQIATTSTYSAPTLGSQTIASGTTYTNIDSLTINSTTIPSTKTLIVTTDKLSTLAATTSAELAGVISDETGSGALVFATSPTLVTPNLGTPSAINLTNATAVPTDATKANLASPTFTGTVTIPTGAVITSPKIGSTYTAKTASYTFASGDEGQLFSMNNAATQQFNIPTDATFNFAVGTEINVFWITGAGQPTIGAVTPGTTTVISTGATSATPKLRVANSGATCKKIAANSWIVFGDLS